jgi:tetratricopeptide (TPR) repeat protein
MKKLCSNLALFAAITGACLIGAGCETLGFSEVSGSKVGMSGIHAFWNGDYKKANEIFADEYQRYPNDLYVLHNLAYSYSALGDREKAVPLFHKLAAAGHNEYPQHVAEIKGGHPSFTDVACFHLKRLQEADSNCTA